MAIFNGVDYNLEYRSKKDEAWYTCGVVLEDGKQLRVKFRDFIQSYFDEVYSIANFLTHHEIEQFLKRFRPVSELIEYNECSRVIEGMKVCAMYKGADEVLYFDAIVDAVHHKEHTPEKCLCTYLLFWQHGHGEGNMTATTLEDIYLIMHGAIHPKIAEFTNLVKQQLEGVSLQSQASFSVNVFGSVGCSSHVGSSAAQTYVFPSSLAETYARGAIMVDSSIKLKRVYEFINNPNHFITSFSGRPWVIVEDSFKTGTLNTNLQSLQPKYENCTKNELKIVRLGTEEYRKSKQLKDLYLEFRNHLKGLVQRCCKGARVVLYFCEVEACASRFMGQANAEHGAVQTLDLVSFIWCEGIAVSFAI
ncbi:hypothetical protein L1987_40063 [Smallanthus sonchifolius]|uniref:Uncharacterized protein n=1 Tax=Smallanthus sonchifolius TaxID=185202 RepID=A0ACB9GT77_9ASTR|nr:hypothetical protein L1987_40063 [Smallanthus sonchifolius]